MMIDPQMSAMTPSAEAPEAKLAHWKLTSDTPELDWLIVFSSVSCLWILASLLHSSSFSFSDLLLQDSPGRDKEKSMNKAHVKGQCLDMSQTTMNRMIRAKSCISCPVNVEIFSGNVEVYLLNCLDRLKLNPRNRLSLFDHISIAL